MNIFVKIIKLIGLLFVGLSFLILTSCATIVSGTSQVVHVQVVDSKTHKLIHGAKCNITDPKGVIYLVNTNPGSVSIPKVYGNLTINCKATGYYQQQIGLGSSFNAWTLGDILFWPGAIVDMATGAAKKYPSHITVLMSTHAVKDPVTTIKAS